MSLALSWEEQQLSPSPPTHQPLPRLSSLSLGTSPFCYHSWPLPIHSSHSLELPGLPQPVEKAHASAWPWHVPHLPLTFGYSVNAPKGPLSSLPVLNMQFPQPDCPAPSLCTLPDSSKGQTWGILPHSPGSQLFPDPMPSLRYPVQVSGVLLLLRTWACCLGRVCL